VGSLLKFQAGNRSLYSILFGFSRGFEKEKEKEKKRNKQLITLMLMQ